MKKYKLIKEYPGAPSLGTIAKYSESHGAIEFTSPKGKLHYSGSDAINFFENLVSSQPEFWEEVVEKDYEILSLARFCSIKPTITDVTDYTDGFIEALLKCDNARIHSVKRLSDGEIFTVGDVVTERMSDKTNVIIKRFNIHLDKLIVEVSKGSLNTTVELIFLNKVKQLLFTTEDGVDIYDGDNYCSLDKRTFTIHNVNKIAVESFRDSYRKDIFSFFRHKQKAEEYILMNKPCLSVQDVLDNYSLSSTATFDNLKQLVKQRTKCN